MKQVFSIDRRKWGYMEATNPWLLQPSMDSCQGGCRRADGRAECGNSGTSWGANRNRFQKSATEVTCLSDVPRSLPSSIFDFVPRTLPSWSPKVYAPHGRTLYIRGLSVNVTKRPRRSRSFCSRSSRSTESSEDEEDERLRARLIAPAATPTSCFPVACLQALGPPRPRCHTLLGRGH